ncbi:hypothetical protein JCM10213_003319 [Rhodosporidiobolus nylandii]
MNTPPSPTSSLHLYTPLVHPAFFTFLDDLLVVPSPTLLIFLQAVAQSADLAGMTLINTGSSLLLSDADPRPAAAFRRQEATSSDLRFIELLDIRAVDGDVQGQAKSVNGMVAWHDLYASTSFPRRYLERSKLTAFSSFLPPVPLLPASTRFDVDTLNFLLAGLFSRATTADIARFVKLCRESLNPPASLINGTYFLQFTLSHLGTAGSARLTRQQYEWDVLVDHIFEGKLANPAFQTNYTPIRRSAPAFGFQPPVPTAPAAATTAIAAPSATGPFGRFARAPRGPRNHRPVQNPHPANCGCTYCLSFSSSESYSILP